MRNAEVGVLQRSDSILLLDLQPVRIGLHATADAMPFRYAIGAPSVALEYDHYRGCVEALYGVKKVSKAAFDQSRRLCDGLTVFKTGGSQLHERARLIQDVLAAADIALDVDHHIYPLESVAW